MLISELYIHPVKSMAAQPVSELTFTDLGPKHDRQWMLISDSGKFMSQRHTPVLCRFFPRVSEKGLVIEFEGKHSPMVTFKGHLTPDTDVSVWGDEFRAIDCGNEIAEWLGEMLNNDVRLVEISEHSNRQIDTDYAQKGQYVGFADGFPTLVASSTSLMEFNSHLESPIDMRRFRPNIVIDGAKPYAEDQWQKLRIGELELELVKPCSRCIMPSINPDNATKEMAVNQVLQKTRRKGRETYFGQNALHSSNGKIRIGQPVSLVE